MLALSAVGVDADTAGVCLFLGIELGQGDVENAVFVAGDDVAFIDRYKKMLALDAFRLMNRRIKNSKIKQ